MPVEPFVIDVEQQVLDDLRDRLRRTRWTSEIPGSGWEYGTDLSYLQRLCTYWLDEYDWSAAQQRLNHWPNFLATTGATRIHLLHARSSHPNAVPLLLLHGWPGSVVEFLDVIDPLVDPPAHGGDASDAFHVICPSLPGYAWSGPTVERGWSIRRAADAFVELMVELGYPRFAVHGGDWGALAASQMGAHHPASLLGIHITIVMTPPPGEADLAGLSDTEMAALMRGAEFQMSGTGYSAIHRTRPQTISHALADSPAGLAGWIVDKFRAWSDCDGDVERAFSRDALLTNIMAYWVTGTIGSSIRMYYESMQGDQYPVPEVLVTAPTGVAVFPKEIFTPPRRWVENHYNLQHWSELPRGGHFGAMEQPDLLVDDVRAFFRALR